MSSKPWTTTEVNWLKANYNLYSYVGDMLPHLPGRTLNALEKMMQRLGLKLSHPGGTPLESPLEIWWALQKKPMTKIETAEMTGYHRYCVEKVLKEFREAGVIYTCHWVKPYHRGRWQPVWATGDGLPRRKPTPTGRTDKIYSKALTPLKGNPFSLMLLEANNANAEHKDDVCAG